jgi:hypothetical protein
MRSNYDGFVKKSICGVALHLSSLRRTISTTHSSRFARLAAGAFYCAVHLMTSYDSINYACHRQKADRSHH